jgi:hypothetical protein
MFAGHRIVLTLRVVAPVETINEACCDGDDILETTAEANSGDLKASDPCRPTIISQHWSLTSSTMDTRKVGVAVTSSALSEQVSSGRSRRRTEKLLPHLTFLLHLVPNRRLREVIARDLACDVGAREGRAGDAEALGDDFRKDMDIRTFDVDALDKSDSIRYVDRGCGIEEKDRRAGGPLEEARRREAAYLDE